MHTVTLIPGDGTGPELVEVLKKCIAALKVPITWDVQQAGLSVFDKEGDPLPSRVIESIKKNKVAIKGPLTTPIGTGMRSVNVALRKALDLYINFRPCKMYKGIKSPYAGLPIDIIIFRENTDDLYVGYEFEKGKDNTKQLISDIKRLGNFDILPDSGISIKPISVMRTQRICKAAFEYAVVHKRKKVTCVHKANIMKFSDGLFLSTFREIAKQYPSVIAEDRVVDNMCMQLVQKPQDYDILVCPNLYGDIISDLSAGLIGGLGIAPGANRGNGAVVFEPVHGSAPKYAGKNKVNPTALLLSAVLMLHQLGEHQSADILEQAVSSVIAKGKEITYDLAADGAGVGTSEMGDAICQYLKNHFP